MNRNVFRCLSALFFAAVMVAPSWSGLAVRSSIYLVAQRQAIISSARPILEKASSITIMPVDEAAGTVTLVDGDAFPLSSLFKTTALTGSPVAKAFADQYGRGLLVAIWSDEKEQTKDPAWNLVSTVQEVHLAFFDISDGALLHQTSKTGRAARQTADDAINEAIRTVINRELNPAVETAFAKLRGRESSFGDRRYVIMVNRVSEAQVLEIGDDFRSMVKEASGGRIINDDYAPSNRIWTLRIRGEVKPSDLYLALFARLSADPKFRRYALNMAADNRMELTALEPREHRVIIMNVAQSLYHERQSAFERVLPGAGVGDVRWKYVPAEAPDVPRLEFACTFDGPTEKLEKQIWEAAKGESDLANLKLIRVGGGAIIFEGPYNAGEKAGCEFIVNNVAPDAYRRIGGAIEELIRSLPSVANLAKRYDGNAMVATYSFESAQTAADIDASLARRITASAPLKRVIQDGIYDRTLSWFYADERTTLGADRFRLEMRNLDAAGYRDKGRPFLDAARGIAGVEDATQRYDEQSKTLTVTFRNEARTLAQIDEAMWRSLSGNRLFDGLEMAGMTDNGLIYRLAAAPNENPEAYVVYLNNVSPRDFYKIGAAFSGAILHAISGGAKVQYRYQYDDRTVIYTVQGANRPLERFAEDILNAARSYSQFEGLRPGENFGSRLVFTSSAVY